MRYYDANRTLSQTKSTNFSVFRAMKAYRIRRQCACWASYSTLRPFLQFVQLPHDVVRRLYY